MWLGRATVVAVLLAGGAALAQQSPAALTGFELERLELNPDGQGSLLLGTGQLLPEGALRVSLVGHYEHNPLSFLSDSPGASAVPVVRDRATAHLAAAYALQQPGGAGAAASGGGVSAGRGFDGAGHLPARQPGPGHAVVSGRVGLLSERSERPGGSGGGAGRGPAGGQRRGAGR